MLQLGVWLLEFFAGRGVFSESAVVLRMLKNTCLELPMVPPRCDKPQTLQLAEAVSAKLGKAIARSQSSLVTECKTILDSTIGGSLEPLVGPSTL